MANRKNNDPHQTIQWPTGQTDPHQAIQWPTGKTDPHQAIQWSTGKTMIHTRQYNGQQEKQ